MAIESLQSGAMSKQKVADILVFCSVAAANGSNLSLKELIQLTSLEMSEEQLEKAWYSESVLCSRYEISSGFVIDKRTGSTGNEPKEEREFRAESNISYATKFAKQVSTPRLSMISISGSTSYRSVSRQDDLDFFCIAKKDTLWIFLTKALLKARLFRMRDRNAPWLCLSYVIDEAYAKREFSRPQDALFARDAISAIVLKGEKYYDSLLANCGWMRWYFPRMYDERVSKDDDTRGGISVNVRGNSFFEREFNSLLYLTVGTYIRIKSILLNRKFRRTGQKSRFFSLRIGRNHCIYESMSYRELRRMYSLLERNEESE